MTNDQVVEEKVVDEEVVKEEVIEEDNLDEKDVDDMTEDDRKQYLETNSGTPEDSTDEVVEEDVDDKEDDDTATDKKKGTSDDLFEFDDSEYREKGYSDEVIEDLKKKDERIFHQKKFNDRQSAEVGETRKKKADLEVQEQSLKTRISEFDAKEQELKDDFFENPEPYNKAIAGKIEAENKLKIVADEKQMLTNESIVLGKVPEFADLIDNEISEIVKADVEKQGLDPAKVELAVKEFKSGQWKALNPTIIINLAEKAKLMRTVKDKDALIKKLQNNDSPDVVGKKIAKVAGQRPTAKIGSSAKEIEKDVDAMSEQERLDYLKVHTKK